MKLQNLMFLSAFIFLGINATNAQVVKQKNSLLKTTISKLDYGNEVISISNNSNGSQTTIYSDGSTYTQQFSSYKIPASLKEDVGNRIVSMQYRNDGSSIVFYSDGTTYTTPNSKLKTFELAKNDVGIRGFGR